MAKIIDKMKNIFSDDDDLDYDEYEGDEYEYDDVEEEEEVEETEDYSALPSNPKIGKVIDYQIGRAHV